MNTNEFESKLIPLDQLVDCPLNRRPISPSDDLTGLAASLAQRQEVDLIGRPNAAGQIEVLDGKRRLYAARTRQDIPALWIQVRPACTDAEALQIILVTQLHRKDLDPLDEAAVVRELIDSGLTVEAVADKLGRPAAWVAKRAKLTDFAPIWRGGLADGKYPWATVGYLEHIARLPEAVQIELATDYLEAWRRPRTLDEFADTIRERYLHTLKQAPWKLDDLALSPKAGACTTCAKRSACQTSLFDDQPAATDRCLDALCWSEKLTAHTAAKARALADKHPQVLVLTDDKAHNTHATPPPRELPAHTIILNSRVGLEDCRKTDDGAIPAIDVETGKQTWLKVSTYASLALRDKLGLPTPTPTGKARAATGQPTAEQKRIAKRLALRLGIIDDELPDGDPPSTKMILALYGAFILNDGNPLRAADWKQVHAAEKKPLDDLSAVLWNDLLKRLHYLRAPVRPADLPDEDAIAELEELAALNPADQRKKALVEVPEPKKRKGG